MLDPCRRNPNPQRSDRRVTVPAVLRLHLADDAQRAGPHLPWVDPERGRDVGDPDPREQHPEDREILGEQSGRGGLDRFGIGNGTSDSPAATASIALRSTSTGAFLETIASAWASVAGTAKT